MDFDNVTLSNTSNMLIRKRRWLSDGRYQIDHDEDVFVTIVGDNYEFDTNILRFKVCLFQNYFWLPT